MKLSLKSIPYCSRMTYSSLVGHCEILERHYAKLNNTPSLLYDYYHPNELQSIKNTFQQIATNLNDYSPLNIWNLILLLNRNTDVLPQETNTLLQIVISKVYQLEQHTQSYKDRKMRLILTTAIKHELQIKELVDYITNINVNDIDIEETIHIATYLPIIKTHEKTSKLYEELVKKLNVNISGYLKGKYNDDKLTIALGNLLNAQTKMADTKMHFWTHRCILLFTRKSLNSEISTLLKLKAMKLVVSLDNNYYDVKERFIHYVLDQLLANLEDVKLFVILA